MFRYISGVWLTNYGSTSDSLTSLTSLIFGEQPERIAHGRSFLVSDLSDLLTSLIFGEGPEWFAHIVHLKEGMSESLIF